MRFSLGSRFPFPVRENRVDEDRAGLVNGRLSLLVRSPAEAVETGTGARCPRRPARAAPVRIMIMTQATTQLHKARQGSRASSPNGGVCRSGNWQVPMLKCRVQQQQRRRRGRPWRASLCTGRHATSQRPWIPTASRSPRPRACRCRRQAEASPHCRAAQPPASGRVRSRLE
ncbi:hypothetical protein PVAP13_9NG640666 [Panicum virgatum]|uniref:Uncharacterized protein n=1 Tax=Panicum virgatum TaxID=38727 RepID=A0A8T0N0V8_PANVG|nr:hypothetical protein PVAP13_9NG640666 [Panicum virgatum]